MHQSLQEHMYIREHFRPKFLPSIKGLFYAVGLNDSSNNAHILLDHESVPWSISENSLNKHTSKSNKKSIS